MAEDDRIHVERRGQLVHLRFVRETGLHSSEAAHRSGRRVVGVRAHRVDPRVGDAIGPGSEARRIRDHGRGRRCVRPAVEHDRRADEHELAAPRRPVPVPKLGRMPMDVSVKRLFPPVGHPYRPSGRERQEAGVDLERDVFARPESAADAGKYEMHFRLRQAKARRDLPQILMEPLCRDVELDAAVAPRDREACFRAERGLILHGELVLAFDDDVGLRVRIAVFDENVLDHVTFLVQRRGVRLQRRDGIGDRCERLVPNGDRACRKAGLLGGLRRDDRDRFPDVANLAAREDGLVELHETEELARRQLCGGDDRLHAAHLLRGGGVDPGDARMRVRAPKRRAEQHAFASQIAAVLELALHLGRAVRPLNRLAHTAADLRAWRSAPHRRYIALDARSTASSIFP